MYDRTYKQLTREDEQEHFRRLRENGDQKSREILFLSAAAWAKKLAVQFVKHNKFSDINDAVSVAYMATLNAIDKIDTSRGVRLSTYMVPAIRHAIRRAKCSDKIIHAPSQHETQKTAFDSKNFYPCPDVGSLDVVAGDDQDYILAIEPSQPLHRNDELIEELLGQLSKRERFILHSRFWEGKKLEAIARELGITRQRVQQIEVIALDNIRAYWRRTRGKNATP